MQIILVYPFSPPGTALHRRPFLLIPGKSRGRGLSVRGETVLPRRPQKGFFCHGRQAPAAPADIQGGLPVELTGLFNKPHRSRPLHLRKSVEFLLNIW